MAENLATIQQFDKTELRQSWCKGCGICIALCPKKILELDENGKVTMVASDLCTSCGQCEIHCPDFAISLRGKLH